MNSAYNGHFLVIKFTLTVHESLFRYLEIPAVQCSYLVLKHECPSTMHLNLKLGNITNATQKPLLINFCVKIVWLRYQSWNLRLNLLSCWWQDHILHSNSVGFTQGCFFWCFLSLPIQTFCGLRNLFCYSCLSSSFLCCLLLALCILFCFHRGYFIWIRCLFCSSDFFYMWLNKIWFRRSNKISE